MTNYERRYESAQRRKDSAATRLAARTLSPELEALAARYDNATPQGKQIDPELAAWREERGVE